MEKLLPNILLIKKFKPRSFYILLHIFCILQRIFCTFRRHAFHTLQHIHGIHRRIAVLFEELNWSYFCIHPHTSDRRQRRLCINFRIVPCFYLLYSCLRTFHTLLHMTRTHQRSFAFLDYPFCCDLNTFFPKGSGLPIFSIAVAQLYLTIILALNTCRPSSFFVGML